MEAIVANIIKNIRQYLFEDEYYIEIIPGIYRIGFGIHEKYHIEIRYTNNLEYNKQILIDDIWAEEFVNSSNYQNNEKIVLYICHPKVLIENQKIVLDSKLNLLNKYKKITKYFLPLSAQFYEELNVKLMRTFNNAVISFPTKKNTTKKNYNISIITTHLNNSKQLEQTIQSIINQSFQDFEYIIKDAGSTDNFLEMIDKYKPYVSKVISKPDRGIYYGMHEGVNASAGEYFIFLNSDDMYVSPHILAAYNQSIITYQADIYYADILRTNVNRKTICRKGSLKNIYRESSINHTTLMLKRKCYNLVGGFDFTFKYAADGYLTIKLLKAGYNFNYINQAMVIMRAGGASKISFKVFVEEMRCRYLYKKLNIRGYLYIILRTIKNILLKQFVIKATI